MEPSTDLLSPSVYALTEAERARTALAACTYVSWQHQGESVVAPFLEEGGSLLLLVAAEASEKLHAVRAGVVDVGLDASIGGLRLSGEFWPVARSVAEPTVRELRRWHLDCAGCPAQSATELVGLQVTSVELRLSGEPWRRVDLAAYRSARPNECLAVGIRLTGHLNADHLTDVMRAVAMRYDLAADDLLAARVEWIDATSIELSVIDGAGARRFRSPLPGAVRSADQLVDAAHLWLGLSAGS